MRQVLKPFDYSADGIRSERMVAGDVRDFGALTTGLARERFISSDEFEPAAQAASKAAVPLPLVDIPVGWRDLGWPQLKSLASKVSDEPIKSMADATAAVELAVERRAAPTAE